jgi:hypothetical protein
MLAGAGPANAGPLPPAAHIVDGGDSYINGTEITSVDVNVTYGPGIAEIKVRIVPSATCDPSATPTVQKTIAAPNPAGAVDEPVNFDLSDATMTTNGLPIFPESSALCALTRAGYFDADLPGIVYGQYGESDNRPVKDTIVLAGTVNILDPVSPDWLNAVEAAATPDVGSPAGSIVGVWQANPDSDAINATVHWDTPGTPDVSCGPFAGYDASSLFYGGLTADQTLANACAAAPSLNEGEEISFNAAWGDTAGNTSPLATTLAFPDGNLKKDTVAPAKPVLDMLGADVSWNPPLQSGPLNTILSTDVINEDNEGSITAEVAYTDTDLDYIDVTITDGVTLTPLSQRRDPIDNPQAFSDFDLTGLINCGTGPTAGTNNPPTHVPHASLGAAPVFPGQCITATAISTDLAGNPSAAPTALESDPATDLGFKDSRSPLAPVATWVPNLIVDNNDQLTELEVTGEPFAVVVVDITDEDPSSVNLTNGTGGSLTKFRLDETGFGAINVDVTTMSDGALEATVSLIDPWGNDGPSVIKNATKNLTTPSLELTSPAQDSMNARTVAFSGVAKYNTVACANCRITIYDHPGNIPNYGNPANVAIVTTTSDAQGRFTANYTYNTSQVKRSFFRATNLSNPLDPINGRPSAVRRFKVDVRNPQIGWTSAGEKTYMPGEPVIISGTATDDFSGVSGVELIVQRLDPIGGMGPFITQGRPPSLTSTVFVVPGNQTNCSQCPGGLSATWSYDFSNLPAGRYTIQAHAVDMARQDSGLADQSFNKLG